MAKSSSKKDAARREELETYVARIKDRVAREMNGELDRGLKINLEKRTIRWGSQTFYFAAKSMIEIGMIHFRFENDLPAALAKFQWGADFCAQWMEKYFGALRAAKAEGIDLGREGYLSLLSFDGPMFCALLAGDWSRAVHFATLVLEPEVLNDTGSDAYQLFYAALVRDDRAQFESVAIDEKRLQKLVWKPYPAIARAVMARDQPRFDALLNEAEQDFMGRAKYRGSGSLLYGQGKNDNPLVIDCMSTCLCKIATKLGMRVAKDSEIIPAALTHHWQ